MELNYVTVMSHPMYNVHFYFEYSKLCLHLYLSRDFVRDRDLAVSETRSLTLLPIYNIFYD